MNEFLRDLQPGQFLRDLQPGQLLGAVASGLLLLVPLIYLCARHIRRRLSAGRGTPMGALVAMLGLIVGVGVVVCSSGHHFVSLIVLTTETESETSLGGAEEEPPEPEPHLPLRDGTERSPAAPARFDPYALIPPCVTRFSPSFLALGLVSVLGPGVYCFLLSSLVGLILIRPMGRAWRARLAVSSQLLGILGLTFSLAAAAYALVPPSVCFTVRLLSFISLTIGVWAHFAPDGNYLDKHLIRRLVEYVGNVQASSTQGR